MTDLTKFEGWDLSVDAGEPMVLDEELGRHLGFARPRRIRELVERMLRDGILQDSDVRPVVGRTLIGVAERVVTKGAYT